MFFTIFCSCLAIFSVVSAYISFFISRDTPLAFHWLFVLALCLFGIVLYAPGGNRQKFPYFDHQFNVSGKRMPRIEDYIDRFIISGGFLIIEQHEQRIREWEENCEEQIKTSRFPESKRKRYLREKDEKGAYRFSFVRDRTRYKYAYYQRIAYTVQEQVEQLAVSYEWLCDRYEQLEAIDFERPLSEYNSVHQRRMMTRELRKKVMERDNYTCQICGKYMPDEVGLHIDHIIPVSKGGKSVMSNLQVLCSKCNGKKFNKTSIGT